MANSTILAIFDLRNDIRASESERNLAKPGADGEVNRGWRGERQRGLLGVSLRDYATAKFDTTAKSTETTSVVPVRRQRRRRRTPSILGLHYELGRVSIHPRRARVNSNLFMRFILSAISSQKLLKLK